MGKGDKKTKRGKINLGSFGKLRPSKKNKEKATQNEPASETKKD